MFTSVKGTSSEYSFGAAWMFANPRNSLNILQSNAFLTKFTIETLCNFFC